MAITKFTNSKGTLKKLIFYIIQPSKTERHLVSGKDCMPASCLSEMTATKHMFRKLGGRQYIHLVQSFAKDDAVTYEQAHEIALKLAQRFEGFQVLMATHKDRDHVHNHLLINSVNFETGYKWQQTKKQMQGVKDYSDELCRQYQLSVIEHKGNLNMSQSEYKLAVAGESWKWQLINTIDSALELSQTKSEFIEYLSLHGYQVNWTDTRKYITYTTPEGFKCRDSKLQNIKYLKENMEHEFNLRTTKRTQQTEGNSNQTRSDHRSVRNNETGDKGHTGVVNDRAHDGGLRHSTRDQQRQAVGSGKKPRTSDERTTRFDKDDR